MYWEGGGVTFAVCRALALLTAPVALAQQPSPFLSVPDEVPDTLRFGAQFPEFEAKDIAGRTWRFEDLRGKLTLIYIWGTFEARATDQLDPHARANLRGLGLPDLSELQRFYNQAGSAKNIQVLTFCADHDYTHAPGYMKERKYTFPVIADWVLIDKLFPNRRSRQWLVNPEGRLSNPLNSWSLGRLLLEVERAAARN
jgi:peroxiredoxin